MIESVFEFDTIDEMIVDNRQADFIKRNCYPVTCSCVSLHEAVRAP